jgi:hypothetical protein
MGLSVHLTWPCSTNLIDAKSSKFVDHVSPVQVCASQHDSIEPVTSPQVLCADAPLPVQVHSDWSTYHRTTNAAFDANSEPTAGVGYAVFLWWYWRTERSEHARGTDTCEGVGHAEHEERLDKPCNICSRQRESSAQPGNKP